jgi:hypothetical protein
MELLKKSLPPCLARAKPIIARPMQRATHKTYATGEDSGNGGGNQSLCSLCSPLFKCGPGGVVELDFDKSISDGVNMKPESFRGYANPEGVRGDFVLLARNTAPALPRPDIGGSSYIDNRPLLAVGKPELRQSASPVGPKPLCLPVKAFPSTP